MTTSLQPLDLHRAYTEPLPPLDFVLPGLLSGMFGLIVAPGGTGKTLFGLDVVTSIALGREVAGGLFPACAPAKAVYLAAEESERMLTERLRTLLRLDEWANSALHQHLIVLPLAGVDCTLIAKGKTTALFEQIQTLAAGARLIIVDPIRRLHDGEENDSASATRLVVAMERLANVCGAAVIGIHHANRASVADTRSQNAARGSSALVDGARWQVNLSRMDEKNMKQAGLSEDDSLRYVALDFAKANYLPPQPRAWLKRGAGGHLSVTKLPTGHSLARKVGGAHLL